MMVGSRLRSELSRALATAVGGSSTTVYGNGMVAAAKASHVVRVSITVL